ncbi:MAG: glycosyltransferase [Beijerinckiaceae bacterium]
MAADRIPVVVAAPPMRTGGTEQHLLYILPLLVQRGFDITAVLLEQGGALESPLREAGVTVVVPPFRSPRPIRTLIQSALVHRAVNRTGARIVHAYLSEPYLAAALAHLSPIGKASHLVHGRRSLAFYSDYHPIARLFERKAHRMSTALVGNSSAVASELVTEAGTADKVCVIHNGIPIAGSVSQAERLAARQIFGLSPDAFVMTLVANLHAYKGHSDLVATLGMIAPQLPQPWHMLLAGRDEGIREKLQSEINRLNIAGNVVFTGEWKGSRQPYAAADVGLLISHTEGFSNSLIEGMAAGLPMIATRVGGNIDAVDDGETGFLVAPKNPLELAEAILKLAHGPALRAQLGEASRQKALAQFSLEQCVNKYEAFWRGLAEGRSGLPSSWV